MKKMENVHRAIENLSSYMDFKLPATDGLVCEDLGEGDVDVKADHNRCHPGVQGYRGELDRL